MATQQNDIIFIPTPTGIQGQNLGDVIYAWPGASRWNDNLYTGNRSISDSGSNDYYRFHNRYQEHGTLVQVGQ